MKRNLLILLIPVLLLLASTSFFVVDERKQALVLIFGRVQRVETEPGFKFKFPIPINTVIYFDKRILSLDTTSLEVTPLDERRLVVDAFARWRITDPVRFRQAVRVERAALMRLEKILNSSLRQALGGQSSDEIVSGERANLMREIRDAARVEAESLGVEIVDVRIRRADLPAQNLEATYDRMKAERAREAADERARGREAAQKLRAEAERQAVELVSEAQKKSEIIKGNADAERTAIFSKSSQLDPDFYYFYRSLSAYKKSFDAVNSTLILSTQSDFLEYFQFLKGGKKR
jgi:membrane protease subunit HflC